MTAPAVPDHHTAPASPQADRPPRRPGRRWLAAALAAVASIALLLGGLGAGLYWGATTAPGTAWWLARVPGLEVVEPQGALTGDFSARQATLTLPGGGMRLRLEDVRWAGLRITRADAPGAWFHLLLDELRARSLRIEPGTAPSPSKAPGPPPTHLRLPLQLSLDQVRLGELHTPGLADPLRALQVDSLRLGGKQGRLHSIEGLRVQWGRMQAEVSGQVGTSDGLPVSARLKASSLFDPPPEAAPQGAAAPSKPAKDTAPDAPPASASPTASSAKTPPPWQLELHADGTLPQLALTAQLRPAAPSATRRQGNGGAATHVRPAAELDSQALLQPFEPWLLGALQLQAAHVDLSAFHGAAPRTDLGGQAELRTSGQGRAATAAVDLRNDEPGLWDAGRLPLRRLKADASGLLQASSRWELKGFEVDLGGDRERVASQAEANAGRISGQGHYAPDGWALSTEWDGVRPDGLHSRAAAMRLSGPLKAQGRWPSVAAPPPLPAASSPRAPASRWDEMTLQLQAGLKGQLTDIQQPGAPAAGPRDVEVAVDLQGQALQWDLKKLQAAAGTARLSLQGSAERASVDTPWRLRAQGQLRDFDPRPWWRAGAVDVSKPSPSRTRATTTAPSAAAKPSTTPGSSSTALASARANTTTAPAPTARHLLGNDPTRLQADAKLDLRLPFPTELAGGTPWFAALQGQASVDLQPSQLAGVPVQGQLRWRRDPPGERGANEALAALELDGNRLRLEAEPRDIAAAVKFDLDAPLLARLSPLWRLFGGPAAPGGANQLPLSGELKAEGSLSRVDDAADRLATAAWRSAGTASARQLRAGPWQLAQGSARWNGSLAPGSDIEAQLSLQQALMPGFTLNQLNLQLQGKTDAHQLTLQAESPSQPPVWMASLQPPPGGAGTASTAFEASSGPPSAAAPPPPRSLAVLEVRGGLAYGAGPGRPTGWNGSVAQVQLHSSDPRAAPWFRSGNVGIGVQWAAAPDGTAKATTTGAFATRVTVQAGRAELPGAGLRWERIEWQAAAHGQPAQIEAKAELDAFSVAPLLARLQPDFGWGGDLRIGGKLNLRSAPTFEADVVVERLGGDLTVTEDGLTRSLGLSDLRLGLNARNGVWNFSQGLAGDTLGVAAGLVVARTSPTATWPSPDTPIEGVLDLQVANLGTWGPWLPTGWRLSGQMRTSASIAGRFGAPEITGKLTGSQIGVRNLVEGVAVSDGEVSVSLQGDVARIERFTARAGAGTVSLTGQVDLGENPQAQLKLVAESFQLLGRVDRRVVTSGQAQLRLDRDSVDLAGRFTVDEGLFDISKGEAPTLGNDVIVMRPVGAAGAANATMVNGAPARETPPTTAGPPSTAPPTVATARQVKLDLQVDLGERLRLVGRGINAGLHGELRITSPNNKLAVHGTVRTRRGTYDAYSQKLVINRGEITFNGNPSVARLDIEATRPNTDVRVGVAVTGTTISPRVRLFSEPEMSEMDKLSWLVLGRESSGLGGADTALLQSAALALLSGEDGSKSDQLLHNLGIDDLSLRQGNSSSTGGDTRDTIVSLGKQVSRNLYVGYERSLSTTAGNWQVIYRLAQRFTLRAQSGQENSLDLIWTWRWQ